MVEIGSLRMVPSWFVSVEQGPCLADYIKVTSLVKMVYKGYSVALMLIQVPNVIIPLIPTSAPAQNTERY